MDKIKLLFVYRGLEQAGSQRWIYEICRQINKDKFEVGVLCDQKYLNTGEESTYENYYYLKLKEINVNLYEYIGHESPKLIMRGIRKIKKIVGQTLGKKWHRINKKTTFLFRSYDVICIIDFLGYKAVKNELYRSGNNKFFVVLHSHKFQFESSHYRHFDPDKSYNFTYFCPRQITEVGESGFDLHKNRFFYNPLVLNLSDYPRLFNPITEEAIVIAIFTRISKMKPIDVFISAFAELQKKLLRECVLNIYGTIQDDAYYQQLKELIEISGVDQEAICFKGHSDNIADTISKDKINVYWGMSINTSIGYASIELGAMGVPCFFWNYDAETGSDYVSQETCGMMPAHNKLNDFVATNLKYLSEDKLLSEFSHKQREYFIVNHNIVTQITRFEDYVKSIKIDANRKSDILINASAEV